MWGKTSPKPSLTKAADVHARGNISAVTRYFNSHVRCVSGANPEEQKTKRLGVINALVNKDRGNPDFLAQAFFTRSECDTMKEHIVAACHMGFAYEMTTFAALCQGIARARLQAEKEETGEDFIDALVSKGGQIPDCGYSWYRT